MRCETSFFSLTLYKKLLTRHWPIWAVWLAGWLAAMPIALVNQQWDTAREKMAASFAHYASAASPLVAVMAILVAIGVFFHLFNPRAAVLMGGLPLRREGIFATAWAAGLTMLLIPLALVALITLPVEAFLGCLYPADLLQWLGGSALVTFFSFSFATLCCVISGNAIAAASFYVIFNGVVLVMSNLIESLLSLFFYGYGGLSYGVSEAVSWCTPLINLFRQWDDWWDRAFIYAGVGFLMLLASLFLHHIRQTERTGDLISFIPLRYAFKVCVILCGGLSLGILFCLFFVGSLSRQTIGLPLVLCCCVAAAISAFVAEMLLRKTFRVLSSWRWALGAVAVFALLLAALHFDLPGYVTRIPQPGTVASATAHFSGSLPSDSLAYNQLSYDGADADALLAVHRWLVDHRDDPNAQGADDGEAQYYNLELTYTLQNGRTLSREYSVYSGSQELQALWEKAVLAGHATLPVPFDRPPDSGWVTWDSETSSIATQMSPAEAADLWAAAQDDAANGRYAPQPGVTYRWVSVHFTWKDAWGEDIGHQYFTCGPETTATNALIQRLYPTPPSADTEAEGWDSEVVD